GHHVAPARHKVRATISLTGQFAAVDERQTGAENLRMMARLSRLPRAAARRRADELLDRFGLTDAADRLVATYSGGMRRRLDLAAGLVASPTVLFLDEPTTGLDPRSRRSLWSSVRELSAAGATVFLTTQYLEEADELAHRIAVLHEGRVAAQGTPAELKSRVPGHRLDLTLSTAAAYTELAPRAVRHTPHTRTLGLPTDGSAAHVRALLDELDPTRSAIASFTVRTATLDDVFLALTDHSSSSSDSRPEATHHVR
ncbi:ATP-binding cassette domain-containing protein, partial [Streptomyces sp. NPDC054863]